jgi:hypothetical protein
LSGGASSTLALIRRVNRFTSSACASFGSVRRAPGSAVLLAQLVAWSGPHTGRAAVRAPGIVAIADPTLKRTQAD